MEFTVYMRKVYEDGSFRRVELISDKNQSLGRCRGRGNYITRRPDGRHFRCKSMLWDYKYYKELGFKVVFIDYWHK